VLYFLVVEQNGNIVLPFIIENIVRIDEARTFRSMYEEFQDECK